MKIGPMEARESQIVLAHVFGNVCEQHTSKVAVSGTAAATTLEPYQQYRLIADTDCHISVQKTSDAAATTAAPLFKAGVPEVVRTTETRIKLSVIRATADGSLWVSKLTAED